MHVWGNFLVFNALPSYHLEKLFWCFIVKNVFLILIPFWFILFITSYALHISLDVLFVIGFKRIRLPSVLYSTMMYLLPWLDTTENCLVWSVYMMHSMSSMWTLISLTLVCGEKTMCGPCSSLICFIDCSPCLLCCMCPFCALSDSGKNFITAAAMSIGPVAKKTLIALSRVAFVGDCWKTRCCMVVPDDLFGAW